MATATKTLYDVLSDLYAAPGVGPDAVFADNAGHEWSVDRLMDVARDDDHEHGYAVQFTLDQHKRCLIAIHRLNAGSYIEAVPVYTQRLEPIGE